MKRKRENGTLRFRTKRNEEDENYETSALVDPQLCSLSNPQEFEAALQSRFNAIPGHRPVKELGSPANTPLGRPGYIITPGGRRFPREKVYGCIMIFSKNGATEVIRNKPKINARVAEVLKKCETDTKEQTIIVTPKLLDQLANGKNVKRGTKGVEDQNRVMAETGYNKQEASATKIAMHLQIREDNEPWEWLHLVAYMLRGPSAQNKNNLTGGTKDANTDMIFGENEVIFITYELQEEVQLIVKADEFPGTHFAKEIKFTIMTKSFTINFIFDAQTSIQPSYRNKSYIHALVETLIEDAKGLLSREKNARRSISFSEEEEETEQLQVSNMPMTFFSYSPKLEKNEELLILKKEDEEEQWSSFIINDGYVEESEEEEQEEHCASFSINSRYVEEAEKEKKEQYSAPFIINDGYVEETEKGKEEERWPPFIINDEYEGTEKEDQGKKLASFINDEPVELEWEEETTTFRV